MRNPFAVVLRRARALMTRTYPGGSPMSAPAVAAQMAGTSVHAGGVVNRLTADWVTTPLSIDREVRYDLWRLRARSRDLARNFGFAVRFLSLLQDNVIGHHGIALDVDTGDDALDKQIEAAWKWWGHAENCSADGKLSWLDTERLVLRTMATDGEPLVRFLRGAANPFGLTLQIIDPDLLDQNWNQVASDTQNEIRMGIERDIYGKPVAYHLWTFHPNDYDFAVRYGERKRVPADEVLHLFAVTRAGQTRGLPWFSPVLMNAQMLRGYHEAAVVAARQAAATMGFLIPGENSTVVPQDPPNDTPLTIDAVPGEFPTLPQGYTVHDWNPNQPSTEFPAFVKAMLREIASGLNVSYNALANDLESVNYSSMRAGTLADRDAWRALQTWMVEHFHRRVFGEWLKFAILTGELPRAAEKAFEEGAVDWKARGYPWVDPLKDTEADVLRIQNGLDSRTDVVADTGEEVEQVFAKLGAEKALAKKLGIEIEAAVTTPRKPPPDTSEEATPAPNPGEAAGGGNGNGGKGRAAVIAALKEIKDE